MLLPGTSTSKYLPGPVALRLRLRGHPVLVGPKAVLATWEADLCARAPLAGEGAGPAEAVAWQSVATASFARAELGPGSTYSPHVAAALRGNKGTWMFAELYQSMSFDQAMKTVGYDHCDGLAIAETVTVSQQWRGCGLGPLLVLSGLYELAQGRHYLLLGYPGAFEVPLGSWHRRGADRRNRRLWQGVGFRTVRGGTMYFGGGLEELAAARASYLLRAWHCAGLGGGQATPK